MRLHLYSSSLPTRAPDRTRRQLASSAIAVLLAPAILLHPRHALAGAQQYEPLADAVRAALAEKIADGAPPTRHFARIEERIAFLDWLGEMSERLKARKPDYRTRVEFLRTLDYEAIRAGLDRQMVLGLIQVESNFRKYVISSAGARGYMQVMPFWAQLIGDGDVKKLFDMRSNLRYGCVIMRHYLDLEKGDLFLALGRYNGSRGQSAYPNAVLAAWKNSWRYEPKRPASRQ
ncbi:MAG: lytic transglycosylase domain-containing protein [Gemmatimonadota bacterium]